MELKEVSERIAATEAADLADCRESAYNGAGNRKARRAAMANAKMRVAVGNSGEVRTF